MIENYHQTPEDPTVRLPNTRPMDDSWTSLTPLQQEVLALIITYIETTEEAVTHGEMVSHLVEEGIGRGEAHDRIEQLLQNGYLYEVDDEIRIPPYD